MCIAGNWELKLPQSSELMLSAQLSEDTGTEQNTAIHKNLSTIRPNPPEGSHSQRKIESDNSLDNTADGENDVAMAVEHRSL